MSDVDRAVGACPYLAAPCRVCCGYHVEGRCRFHGAPERIGDCRPASPRSWFLGKLGELSREERPER